MIILEQIENLSPLYLLNRFRVINLENQFESALEKDINKIINLENINVLQKEEIINKICQIYKEKNEYFRFVKFH